MTITSLVVFLLSLCDISMTSGLILTFVASPIWITTSSVDVYAPSGTPKICNEFYVIIAPGRHVLHPIYSFLQSDHLASFLCG